jgi:RNA polymerase sigma factor (TIGR02999 family)
MSESDSNDGISLLSGKLPQLIRSAESGSREARDCLFTELYGELKRIARRQLARGSGAVAGLGTTTLVHEVYSVIAQRERLDFADRNRFLAYAARAMRGYIIDAARSRLAFKRGGEFHVTQLSTQIADELVDGDDLSRISDALDELAEIEPRLAEVVDLKYFCGFSFAEIAELAQVSERTVQREWEKARLLLYGSLNGKPLD